MDSILKKERLGWGEGGSQSRETEYLCVRVYVSMCTHGNMFVRMCVYVCMCPCVYMEIWNDC